MEKIQIIVLGLLMAALPLSAQRLETVPFGDFEHWTERHIKESAILGGHVKTLWLPGPDELIEKNAPYDYARTPWASSNAYARVAGITKTSLSVEPDKGPSGRCAKLTTVYASCKVAGLVEIKVLAAGSIYWGKMSEPVSRVSDPYSMMDWGIPFTGRPDALVLDYRAVLPNTGMLTKGTTFSHKSFPGKDPCQIMFLLQQRTEDADGNIHARRVGTAFLRIHKSTDGWVMARRIPVLYGDASTDPGYRPYMGMLKGETALYARNSKGKIVPVREEGWAEADAPVTHAVLQICSGSHVAFTGELGNTLWVDNIRLEYAK